MSKGGGASLFLALSALFGQERFDEARKRISALETELAGREASGSQLDALKQQIGGRLGRIVERISELEQRETNKGSDA